MQRRVRKAVFPVAGLEHAFAGHQLVAKEMLPVVDKPLIHAVKKRGPPVLSTVCS